MALFEREYAGIFDGMRDRAVLLSERLNEMENITCNKLQGAMYAFPRLHLGHKVIQKAQEQKVAPDFLYCWELLNATGVQTVPGSGFGQVEGTFHLRMTNLVSPTQKMAQTLEQMADFNHKFNRKY